MQTPYVAAPLSTFKKGVCDTKMFLPRTCAVDKVRMVCARCNFSTLFNLS